MTDRNLLRAQLLIEAADLLNEGYGKPNTNDKIVAAEMNKAKKDAFEKKDGYANASVNAHAGIEVLKHNDLFDPYYISATRAHKNSAVRSHEEKRRDAMKNYLKKVKEVKEENS